MKKLLHLGLGVVFMLAYGSPALALAPQPSAAQMQRTEIPEEAEVVPGEFLVIYEDGEVTKAGKTRHRFEKVNREGSMQAVLGELQNQPGVLSVEPNYIVRAAVIPDDPKYADQWYLQNDDDEDIDANQAWNDTKGTSSVIIAVADSGVDLDHPDLEDKIWENSDETNGDSDDDDANGYIDDWHGWDFVDGDKNPNPAPNGGDDDGVTHGTHVAGIAAASTNNGVGIAGVGWNNQIMALRVLDDKGIGSISGIAEAIEYAVDNGADVVNLSLGTDSDSAVLREAVEYAYANDVIVVAAAGNSGRSLNSAPFYPACYDTEVIGVGATNRSDGQASFSNYGSDCVDVSAPGTTMLSTAYTDDPTYGFTDDYEYQSGTSQATAVVSGIAALARSYDGSLSAAKVANRIIDNADNTGMGAKMGSGRVNANATMDSIDLTVSRASNVDSFNYGDGIRTTWTDNEDNTSHFNVYRKQTNVDDDYKKINSGGRVEGTSYTDKTVEDGKSYRYKVETVDTNSQKSSLSESGGKVKYHTMDRIVVGAGPGGGPEVRVYNPATEEFEYIFNAYDAGMSAGVEVAVGDIDGDGKDEIVTGTGEGGGPQIRVFEKDGTLKAQWNAYDSNFRGGVRVAVGNVDGDSADEIVTVPGPGGTPHVRVWDGDGSERYAGFMALDGKFTGGAFVAVVNFDDTGNDDIAVSAGPGGGAQVTVHNARNADVYGNWFAYDQYTFKGGIRVAAANTDNTGADETFTIPAEGHTHVQFFAREPGLVKLLNPGFYAEPTTFGGGGWIAAGDIQQSGQDDIIVGLGPGTENRVKVFDKTGDPEVENFNAFDPGFTGGVSVSAGQF